MTVQEVLQLVGYPVDYLVLDFESYYDVKFTLSKMSAIEYIKDERFECLGCGFYDSGSDAVWFVTSDELTNFFVKSEQDSTLTNYINFNNYTVVVKNSKFDILLLKEVFGIIPPYIIDTEDLSRHQDSRDKQTLKHQAVKYKLGVKGNTADFKGLHWADMDEVKRKDLAGYCAYNKDSDINLERQLFELLLPQLTNPQLEIPLMRHTLDIYLNPMIDFDFKRADKLMVDMHEEMMSVVAKSEHTIKDIRGDISFATLLQAALGDEPVPTKKGKPTKNMIKLLGEPGVIPALAKDDEGRKILLEHPNEQVRLLMQVRIAAKGWPSHIKRVTKMIAQAHANGGKLAVPLKYYGGHTGRWSGTGGINLQNLGGKGRGKPIHPLIAAVRGLLRA